MQIVYEDQFKHALQEIIHYIAKDKVSASTQFKKELKNTIEDMTDNPKMYRASYYFDDESYRDLTFKGYTVIYKIVEIEETIKVLDIFKWTDR